MDAILDMMWDNERGVAYLVDQRVRKSARNAATTTPVPKSSKRSSRRTFPTGAATRNSSGRNNSIGRSPNAGWRLPASGPRLRTSSCGARGSAPGSHPSTCPPVKSRTEPGRQDDGEPIDIYDRNVLVVGGREGVAAARRFAARVEAACDKHAQLAVGAPAGSPQPESQSRGTAGQGQEVGGYRQEGGVGPADDGESPAGRRETCRSTWPPPSHGSR